MKLKVKSENESVEIEVTGSEIMLLEIKAALMDLAIIKKWAMWKEVIKNE